MLRPSSNSSVNDVLPNVLVELRNGLLPKVPELPHRLRACPDRVEPAQFFVHGGLLRGFGLAGVVLVLRAAYKAGKQHLASRGPVTIDSE